MSSGDRLGRARVLWLAKGLGRGGAEQLLAGCARHVDRERYDVEVAYLLPWKDALVPELRAAGVPVYCLNGGQGGRELDPRWAMRLRRLVRERRYDIVHTHMPAPAVAARVLLAWGRNSSSGPRLVHTEHNLWHRYRRATRWANAATYRRNSAVIAVSKAVAQTIAPNRLPGAAGPAAPLRLIYHGVDHTALRPRPEARDAARDRLGLPRAARVVASVGNFTPKKDQRTLIEALALLRADHPSTRLVLVGAGPLQDQLSAHAQAAGVADQVVFTGTRSDVPELLPAFDVFALSSRQEGLPVAVMEALACGLPVVATRVGGLPEIVTDGVEGRLVAPADPAGLAAALGEVLGDDRLRARMGAAAAVRSREFDIAAAQRQIEDVYAQVLSGVGGTHR
jgi:glycosyltransferase involved in cell wall biosynthesis